MMQWISVLVAILVASPALADRNRATANMWFHVSTDGDDNADCVAAPCRTIQRAYNVVMNDWDFAKHQPYIKLAPGVYRGVKATGQAIGSHVVNIVGQQSSDLTESCDYSQADQVTVENSEADAVFDIQDLASLVVRCLRVRAPNGAGFLVRQTPVSDIAHIIFDVLTFGVIAQENGAINLGGTMWLSNNMTVFLSSNTQSRITVASPIVVLNQINVDYFAMAYQGGHINFYSTSSVLNGEFIGQTSERVYRGGAILTNGIALPGPCLQSDPDQPGNCW